MAAERVTVPVPSFVSAPEPRPSVPLSVVLPAPPTMRPRFELVTFPETVSRFASELIREAVASVTLPP